MKSSDISPFLSEIAGKTIWLGADRELNNSLSQSVSTYLEPFFPEMDSDGIPR